MSIVVGRGATSALDEVVGLHGGIEALHADSTTAALEELVVKEVVELELDAVLRELVVQELSIATLRDGLKVVEHLDGVNAALSRADGLLTADNDVNLKGENVRQ